MILPVRGASSSWLKISLYYLTLIRQKTINSRDYSREYLTYEFWLMQVLQTLISSRIWDSKPFAYQAIALSAALLINEITRVNLPEFSF